MKLTHFESVITDPLKRDALCDAIATQLNLQTLAAKRAVKYALNMLTLLEKKQLDYGPRNISDFGTTGVIIRMNDKMQRLKNLAGKKRRKARNESVCDSFMDVGNYGIIGQMTEAEDWPSAEVPE